MISLLRQLRNVSHLYLYSKGKTTSGGFKPPVSSLKSPVSLFKPPPSGFKNKIADAVDSQRKEVMVNKNSVLSGIGQVSSVTETEIVPKIKTPVVTIMGHVDHGKTTLIDYLRSSNIAEQEEGGITQRIGAFSVSYQNQSITFIDTPGHEAFLNMRERGAKMTDLVVLMVSAVEGVKKQTLEVIEIVKKMGLKVIVALNKIDLPQARPEEIQKELLNAGLNLQVIGGNVPVVHISAKTGHNTDLLCELILEETKENTAIFDALAEARVLQAFQDKEGLNSMTVIMEKGTLRTGSMVVLGEKCFKVKRMKNDNGQNLDSVFPGEAALIVGIPGVPSPGDQIFEVQNEKQATRATENRKKQLYESQRKTSSNLEDKLKASKIKFQRSRQGRKQKRAFYRGVRDAQMNKFAELEDNILNKIEEYESQAEKDPQATELLNTEKEKLKTHRQYIYEYLKNTGNSSSVLNFIMKFADRGMEETIMLQLESLCPKLEQELKIKLNLIKSDVGDVIVNDLEEADYCDARIFTFGSQVSNEAKRFLMEKNGRNTPRTHKLIHNLLKDIRECCFQKKMQSLRGVEKARCQVVETYELDIKKSKKKIPGIRVTSGKISKVMNCYIFRNSVPFSEALNINFLKSFKKQVNEMKKGEEGTICFLQQGVDVQKDDEIVAFE